MIVCEGTVRFVAQDEQGLWAAVDVGGARQVVAAELVPDVHVGDRVVVHAGVAIGRADNQPGETK